MEMKWKESWCRWADFMSACPKKRRGVQMAQKGQIAPVRYRKAASEWPPRVLPHVTGVACGEVVSPSSHCAAAAHDATCLMQLET